MRTEILGCASDLDILAKRTLMYSGAILIKRLDFEAFTLIMSFLCRIMRTEFLGCASNLDYLANLTLM
jgi:hypothetical protein